MLKIFNKECHLYSPVIGEVVRIETIEDKVFSSKMMGEGVAFIISEELICAPCDGVITLIPSTLHAFGITTKTGCEILVHVGLDTVNLQGQGFKKLVEQGQTVKRGTPILKVDLKFMEENQINLTTPMVITNSSDYKISLDYSKGKVTRDRKIISYIKK